MDYGILNYDVLRQQIPFFIFKRIRIDEYDKKFYFNPEIPIGYVYLLRRVHFKAMFKTDEPPPSPKSSYRIEFIRSLRGREMQNLPLPLSLLSTPGWSDTVVTNAPQAVDMDIYNKCFSALPQVKNLLILNYLYQHRETIECVIRHVTTLPSPPRELFYIDLVLDGYFLPEFALEMWK